MFRSLLLVIPLALMGCASKPVEPKKLGYDVVLKNFIEKHGIPGGSIAVSKDGQIVHASGAGFANVETKSPVTPETPFRIASATKPLTAIAVFQILEKSGKDLNTALNKPVFGKKGYLPEYKKIQDKRVYKITLRDLLQHTGGWDSAKNDYDPQYDLYNIAQNMKVKAPADAKSVIKYMLQYRVLEVEPGKEYHYSNFGYNVLARVIEKLSGQSYEKYMQEHVFKPVGVTNMKIAGSRLQDLLPNESRYYDDPRAPEGPSQFDNKVKGPMAYNEFYFPTMDGHGGFLGTPSDLVKIANGVTPKSGGTQLLKPETIAIMTAPVAQIGNPTASMGWVVHYEGGEISHAGALEFATLSYFVRNPDGTAWSVVFNRLPVKDAGEIASIMQPLVDQMKLELK
ncbi:serine hydrolase domain-containing protein [Bdellovibrio sp. HCB209]|uniref:serine hydrolase domain-containing protein n=1 Tax=Bdellovibrio sp. HCB209 TaxID=3394354 RepID=UPI0039B50929